MFRGCRRTRIRQKRPPRFVIVCFAALFVGAILADGNLWACNCEVEGRVSCLQNVAFSGSDHRCVPGPGTAQRLRSNNENIRRTSTLFLLISDAGGGLRGCRFAVQRRGRKSSQSCNCVYIGEEDSNKYRSSVSVWATHLFRKRNLC